MSFDMGGAYIKGEHTVDGRAMFVNPGDLVIRDIERKTHWTMRYDSFQNLYVLVTNKINNMEPTGQTVTDGMKKVGANFNPSNLPEVDEVKMTLAKLIDNLLAKQKDCTGEKARQFSIAITYLEEASMRAVRGITWQY